MGCFIKPSPPEGSGNGVEPNVAFVTSTTRPATALMGLDDADRWCMDAAAHASPPLEGTYKALLSSSVENARDRVAAASGWVRVDGKPFIDRIEDALLLDEVYYPLRIDENGADLLEGAPLSIHWVATGSNEAGMLDVENNCKGFTGTGAIRLGYPDAAGNTWMAGTLLNCTQATMVHLYCLGVDREARIAAPKATGPRIFVTATELTGDATLAGLDMRCTDDATRAGLTGDFHAVTASAASSAFVHAGGTGKTWVRIDGVEVTSDLVSFQAPISVRADGKYRASGKVWTGAMDPATLGTSTCLDWTYGAFDESAYGGDSVRSNPFAFGQVMSSCNMPSSVYCAEAQ